MNKLDRDDAQELDQKIESLKDAIEEGKVTQILRSELASSSIEQKLIEEVSFWVTKKLSGNGQIIDSGKFRPFSGSRYLENQIVSELVLLYENKNDLFWADVSAAGISVSRIKQTGILVADARDVIVALRGQQPSTVKDFVAALAKNNPGSSVLVEAHENISRLTS